jgi:hypothetical protein
MFATVHVWIGLLVLLVVAAFSRSEGLQVMFLGTLALLLLHKVCGSAAHSLHWGRSWPARARANTTAIRFGEPLVTFMAGLILQEARATAMGLFFIVGAFCMFVSAAYAHAADKARERALDDARIDAQIQAEYLQGK